MSLGVVLALLGLPGALPANAAPVPARLHPMDLPNPTWSVPIQISNTQASPTGTYQQMVVVNSSRYAAYLNANDSNVEWRYPNGTAIYAWMESNNSNASTRTTWWLKLYNIPARSNQTVYMDVYGKTDYLLSVDGPSGEAPQLSAVYGGLDNGATVFPQLYDDFSGTSLKSTWTSTTATVNDGVTLTANKLYWATAFVTGPIVISDYAKAVTGGSGQEAFIFLSTLPGFSSYTFYGERTGNWAWCVNGGVCLGTHSTPTPIIGVPYQSDMLVGSSSATLDVNHTQIGAAVYSYPGAQAPGLGSDTSATFYWVMAMTYPPDGIMPTVTFLPPSAPTSFAVTASTASSITLGWSNSGNATNDTLFWGPNCSALRPFTSSLYAGGSLGVRSNLTLLDLPSGSAYCFALESWNLAGVSPLAYTQGRTANLSASIGGGAPAFFGGSLFLVVLVLVVATVAAIVILPAVFKERRHSESKPTRIPAGRSR